MKKLAMIATLLVAAPPGVLVTRCGTTDAAVDALRRLTAEAILSAP